MAKKVTVFMGSPRKKETLDAVKEFEDHLKRAAEIDFEYVFLKDFHLDTCKGCFLCLEKGEEFCSLKDDRDMLIEKIYHSDGVIFATPNYSLQVTAIMKNFLDRLAFVFHRPRFFHKAFTAIVTQGVYGGEDIVKYLEKVGKFWGFTVSKGTCLTTPPGMTQRERSKASLKIKKAAERFSKTLSASKTPSPSLFMLAIFRTIRSSYRAAPDEASRDYWYFRDNGWFTAGYYYDTPIGPVKKLIGRLMDFLGEKNIKRRKME